MYIGIEMMLKQKFVNIHNLSTMYCCSPIYTFLLTSYIPPILQRSKQIQQPAGRRVPVYTVNIVSEEI